MPIRSPKHSGEPALVRLGMAIRRCRRASGISQEGLALETGIDRSYLGSIERGEQNPGVLHLIRISHALKISVTELMRQARL